MVITDQAEAGDTLLLFDERVNPVHLSTDHSAMQFIERLGWAISDAAEAEQVDVRRPTPRVASPRRLGSHRGRTQASSPLARRSKRRSSSRDRPLPEDSVKISGDRRS
jgi:hypothetical protein